jgi:hypothetical protein
MSASTSAAIFVVYSLLHVTAELLPIVPTVDVPLLALYLHPLLLLPFFIFLFKAPFPSHATENATTRGTNDAIFFDPDSCES